MCIRDRYKVELKITIRKTGIKKDKKIKDRARKEGWGTKQDFWRLVGRRRRWSRGKEEN